MTAAADASLWQPVIPTSTNTSLRTTMVTEAPPSAAATTSPSDADEEGTMAQSEGALVMAEEDDSPPWPPELDLEVLILEF